jgi:hypothetical protein
MSFSIFKNLTDDQELDGEDVPLVKTTREKVTLTGSKCAFPGGEVMMDISPALEGLRGCAVEGL